MLIELVNLQSINSHEKKRAFSRLLQAHDDGNHFIFINQAPEELDSFPIGYLNQFERNTYFSIKDDFTTQSQLLNELCIHIKVDFANRTNTSAYNRQSGVIETCYTKFINSQACQATRLVLEDEDDNSLYKEIAMIMNSSTLGTPDTLSYETIHGGGSRTAREFARQRERGYITLCIVDSDKPHPSKAIGGTAQALREDIDNGVSSLSLVKLLDVHEVENLVPISLLETITRQNYRDNLDFFRTLDSLLDDHNELQPYIDFKSGLSVQKAFELDYKHGKFWLRNSITSALLSQRCRQCLRAAQDEQRFDCEREEPCNFLNKYNDSLLTHATRELRSTHPREVLQNLKEKERSWWQDIADLITAWCFSDAARSSV